MVSPFEAGFGEVEYWDLQFIERLGKGEFGEARPRFLNKTMLISLPLTKHKQKCWFTEPERSLEADVLCLKQPQ